ncbi:MAG: hypothetical protein MJA29_01140 [Candidatus Omnitrophica bacterium]|nr:hypothetical protein [Candidatus Omnitrophota bacterium]
MIVGMKKVHIIVRAQDLVETIDVLRATGVMHIEHEQPPAGRAVQSLRDDLSLIAQAQNILQQSAQGKAACAVDSKEPVDWETEARHVVELQRRLEQLQEFSRALTQGISQWEHWGDFDPAHVQALKSRGIHIRLFQVPLREVKKFPREALLHIVKTFRGTAYCVLIAREEIQVPFKELILPRMSLATMKARLSHDAEVIQHIRQELRERVKLVSCLAAQRARVSYVLEYQEVLSGAGGQAQLSFLRGYVPRDAVEKVQQAAVEHKWGIMVEDPAADERVPTLIRNPRWIAVIEPVFKLLAILPGYRELDISLWFLLFFSVFCGILIGDAGYGLIFGVVTLLVHMKLRKKVTSSAPFVLSYLVSIAAVLWGLASATFFGQEWLPASVSPMIPLLRDNEFVQRLCFTIGAVHLSIAHLWRAMIKLPSLAAVGEMGWVGILWAAFFLARTLILGDPFPPQGMIMAAAGGVCVLFFSNPQRNILKGIGSGAGALGLNAINNFTDVVSYIRLFAVGLATVAVADAFNAMALGLGFNSVISGLGAAFIILVGHVLNLILAPMSILVHGVRLNVLEFCVNHLDGTWGGFAYRPFKKR